MLRRAILAMAVGLGAIGLAACGGASQDGAAGGGTPAAKADAGPAPRGDSTLQVALPEDPASLDPATSAAAVERNVLAQMYDNLVDIDADLQPRPGGLTESYEMSEDGKTYTFTLREGITFHNGERFDADAVKAHFDRLEDEELASPYLEDFESLGLEEVEVVDPGTVRFRLSRPSPYFLSLLADPAGGGIPAPEAAARAGRDFGNEPVGSGPFKLESWKRGDAITLVRNDDYWNPEAPSAGKLVFRGFADSNSALSQFLSGQLDIIAQVSPQGVREIEEGGDTVLNQAGISTLRVFFNSTRAPFDDVRVRQAVSAAIGRDTVRRTVMREAAVTAGQPLAPIGIYETIAQEPPARDVERAKELLAEAGLPDGFEFTLLIYADNQEHARAAQLLASQLEEVGIRVRIEPMQLSALLEQISAERDNDYDATLLGGGAGNPDPVPWLYTNFGEHGSSKFGAAKTDAMEQGFQTALSTPDVDARLEALRTVNSEIETEAASQATLWFLSTLTAHQSGVHGVRLSPTGTLDLRGAGK